MPRASWTWPPFFITFEPQYYSFLFPVLWIGLLLLFHPSCMIANASERTSLSSLSSSPQSPPSLSPFYDSPIPMIKISLFLLRRHLFAIRRLFFVAFECSQVLRSRLWKFSQLLSYPPSLHHFWCFSRYLKVRRIWQDFNSMYHFKYLIIIVEFVELCLTSLAEYFLLSELGESKRSIIPSLEVFDINIIYLCNTWNPDSPSKLDFSFGGLWARAFGPHLNIR